MGRGRPRSFGTFNSRLLQYHTIHRDPGVLCGLSPENRASDRAESESVGLRGLLGQSAADPADHSPVTWAVRSPRAISAQTTVHIASLPYLLLFNSNSQKWPGITADISVVTGSNDWGPPWRTRFWALHSTVRCAGAKAAKARRPPAAARTHAVWQHGPSDSAGLGAVRRHCSSAGHCNQRQDRWPAWR